MRLLINFLFWGLLIPVIGYSQKKGDQLKYLEQEPPSLTPKVFAPGLISKSEQSEFGSVFNKEATAFYYGVDIGGRTEIHYTELKDSGWSKPKVILSHEKYGYNDPFLSPDGKRLYFISQRTLDGVDAKQDHDIWYVEKEGDKWSDPINAGSNINTNRDEYYISFTATGTMYFSSNKITSEKRGNDFDVYFSENIDGKFQEAIALDHSINTSNYEADVFIDPKETYIIFCARRPEGLGRGDLYISFKNTDGTWTKSVNMGDKINTKKHELCPFVSHDGKYLFYTSNQDIYWVSAEIINVIKKEISK